MEVSTSERERERMTSGRHGAPLGRERSPIGTLGREVCVPYKRCHPRGSTESGDVVRPDERVGTLHRRVVRVLLRASDAPAAWLCVLHEMKEHM